MCRQVIIHFSRLAESVLQLDMFFRETLEETGYSIADKIDPEQFTEQIINEQVPRYLPILHRFFGSTA